MMKLRNILFAGLLLLGAAACSDNDKPIFPKTPTYDMSGFAKGADVSWLTEMEKPEPSSIPLPDAKRNV